MGVWTDELAAPYKRKPIIPFDERIEVIHSLKLVDMVVKVEQMDCTPMLKRLASEGWKIDYVFHGDDWSLEERESLRMTKEYIESIGGKLILTPYYEGQSTTKIIEQIKEMVC